MRPFWILLFICGSALAQKPVLSDSLALKADSFVGVDSYANYYYTKSNALYKKSAKETISYANVGLGTIANVDIINPLKIVVWYADFNTAVLLDNTLNEIERVNFNEVIGFANIESVSMANNNSLWVFNKDNQQLELYNYRSGVRTLISQPIAGNLLSRSSTFNFCHLLTEGEVITFNVYGSIIEQYINPNYQAIWHYKGGILGLGADLVFYNSISTDTSFTLPKSFTKNTLKQLQLSGDFMYIYDGDFVFTFKLT